MGPKSRHEFRSLTPFERKQARILASNLGLFHWKSKIKVRQSNVEVLMISNDPSDADKKDIPTKRNKTKIAESLKAATKVNLGEAENVSEVLAKPDKPIFFVCTICKKECKSKAGLVAHKRVHKN